MENETQQAIDAIVKRYIFLYPDEYRAVVEQLKVTRNMQINTLATTKQDGLIEQKVYEIPEKLHTMIKKNLTDSQWKQFIANGDPKQSNKNARWFAKTYKQFAIAQKI